MEQLCGWLLPKIQMWFLRGALQEGERAFLQYKTQKIEQKREQKREDREFKRELEKWKRYVERVKRRTKLLKQVVKEVKGEFEEAGMGVEVERDVQEVEVKRSIEVVGKEFDLERDLKEMRRDLDVLKAELENLVEAAGRSAGELEKAVVGVLGLKRDLEEVETGAAKVETDAAEAERDEEVIRDMEKSKEELVEAMRDARGLKRDPTEVLLDAVETIKIDYKELAIEWLWWKKYLNEVKRDFEEAKRGVEEAKSDLQELHAKFHIEIGTVTVRVFNAETGPGDNIKYPLSLAGNPDLPVTHEQLANLTAPGCDAASRALGRPALPPDMPVAQRRQRIGNYLGVSL